MAGKRYGNSGALKKISFEVNRGELFGLIGPDGLEKLPSSDIGYLVAGGKGRVYCGYDTVRMQDYPQLGGPMPGRFSLYQDLTVEENLRFFNTVWHYRRENYGQIRIL